MNIRTPGVLLALAVAAQASVVAQQPAVTIDDDDITLRGCVRRVDVQASVAPTMLVWTRSDIMLAGVTATDLSAPNPVGTSGIAGRVFYWLEDDEDLSKHIGQMIEVKGELEGEMEKGQIEIEREDSALSTPEGSLERTGEARDPTAPVHLLFTVEGELGTDGVEEGGALRRRRRHPARRRQGQHRAHAEQRQESPALHGPTVSPLFVASCPYIEVSGPYACGMLKFGLLALVIAAVAKLITFGGQAGFDVESAKSPEEAFRRRSRSYSPCRSAFRFPAKALPTHAPHVALVKLPCHILGRKLLNERLRAQSRHRPP